MLGRCLQGHPETGPLPVQEQESRGVPHYEALAMGGRGRWGFKTQTEWGRWLGRAAPGPGLPLEAKETKNLLSGKGHR